MIPKRRILVLTTLAVLFFLIAINYSLNILRAESEVRVQNGIAPAVDQLILQKVPEIAKYYNARRIKNDNVTDTLVKNLKTAKNFKNKELLWKEVRSWVSKTQLFHASNPHLGSVLNAMKTAKIVKADIDPRGTQLKLLLTLEGNQEVIFKPKWYPIDKVIEGPVYAGKDRYFSEIVAFYLSAVLEKPLAPLAAERKLSLKYEVVPVATDRLLDTIFEHKSATCVYGKCFYCKREDPACEDAKGSLAGAVILNLDAVFENNRSPWQRTYKKNKKAVWEVNNDYCKSVKSKIPVQRLLDLIDVSIFDFLIQNGDRHHYETLDDNVVWLDNGKGFGNPNVHHVDILAPLYQCCMLRSNTWKRLEQLSSGTLRKSLEKIPSIHNLIAEEHLKAIEQRLLIVYAAVEYCRSKSKVEHSV